MGAYEVLGRVAGNPFYLDKICVKIYSAEELIFSICQNPELLEKDMFSKDLAKWLDEECGASNEAGFVEKAAGGGSLISCVKSLLDYSGFVSSEEKNEIISVLENSRGTSEINRLKVRGDFFLKKRRFARALGEYEVLIGKIDERSGYLKAEVYHSMAVCKANMFLFKQAGEDFLTAYRLDENKDHYYGYMATLRFMLSEREYIAKVSDDPLMSELTLKLEENMERAISGFNQSDEYKDFVAKREESGISGRSTFENYIDNKFEEKKDEYQRLVQ